MTGLECPCALDGSDGLGIHIMRYRAQAIGGSLDVTAGEAGGTVVRCTFPRPEQNVGRA